MHLLEEPNKASLCDVKYEKKDKSLWTQAGFELMTFHFSDEMADNQVAVPQPLP